MAVQTNATSSRRVIHLDPARTRAEIVEGILGIDAALNSVPLELDVVLRDPQRLAHGQQNLLPNQIDPRDLLGDRMLDLNALVDLKEEEVTLFVHDKLDRPRVAVMGQFRDPNRCLPHLLAQIFEPVLNQRRGGLFDNLLVAPLNRTVAFPQMDDIPPVVAQDLKLDVVGILDEFLDVNVRVAERLLRLALGRIEALDQGDIVMGHPHPAPTATCHGLDKDRVADPLRDLFGLLLGFHNAIRTRRHRYARFLGQIPANRLVLQGIHGPTARPDEANVAILANVREVRVLRQEPIPGMDRVHVCQLRGANDTVDPQIALRTRRFTDTNGFISQLHVHRVGVRFGIDRHGTNIQLFAGTNDAYGDFATIRHEDLLEHDLDSVRCVEQGCFRAAEP
eukprot:TRINITY_DN34880_c0_g1_i1.p3 TRINITY_DN34880_c0_g1~~TRINITY_DN34880_c0_g1_i1.p3  ORF type:complete len:393 (-),score=-18.84 TRINITY_DN34880_c0_g1_i1:877-2055(-)